MDFELTKEQVMFKKEVIKFAQKEIVPRVQEHELKGEFDFESFRKLGDFGILGLHFPERRTLHPSTCTKVFVISSR